MLVYRDAERRLDTFGEIARLDRLLQGVAEGGEAREAATEILIDLGALEAAAVDALNPDQDGFGASERAWREASLEAGRLFLHARDAEPGRARASAQAARRALARVRASRPPPSLAVRTPEGYAWYALYPDLYAEAARRFAASSAPLPAVAVGLRGIGTSLSAVVVAALEREGRAIDSLTLRPRGHPYERTPRLDARLRGALRAQAEAGAWFLIVDEGPGLSGSSFCGTAEALARLGAGDEQIVLFPSVETDGAGFRSETARARWKRHRRVHVSFEAARADLAPATLAARDVSGGLWREVVFGGETRPPVAPQHERRKYLSADGEVLMRYAGLGRDGRQKLDRAGRLAEAGFAAEPVSFADGFLATRFVEGRPMRRRDRDAGFTARAAAYVGWLGVSARTGQAVEGGELFAMVTRNVELSLGEQGLRRLTRLDGWRPRLAGAAQVAIDGRMAPHEWIAGPRGVLKTDALDHGDDHFLPGATDIAWDVAGFATEWGLSEAETTAFAEEVGRLAGDSRLAERLPFYDTAYLAFRTGWTHLSASGLPEGPDRRGLRLQERRYRARLDRSLDRLAALS
ncbi:MAG TPA: hypothetical protein VD929_08705 [Caulobacteraceae bacterium]|nr:hypothetical protein [Caulobacteraceae bacterium]